MSLSGKTEWSSNLFRPGSRDSVGIEHFNFKAHVAREERPGGASIVVQASVGLGGTWALATDDLHVFTGLACIGE
eukprot:CAMPEP_0177180712 /NCGR_PEP_ID=MMETSP0367-20130122/15537_1 /TAXON_ID=447022 ORGANISM="Scrippsiella hangoei-like, Strain SHHI-4" /NCGR_SAMPLE_ID=MMETSP0367 /ASSEMBLY_ACC=CAM_ASM_000362 /LENGTH=74 /DNA_ID=CAMNT_0018627513 /DNA_START=174 /DNA_END=395 /DNA_ORIENTATION=-